MNWIKLSDKKPKAGKIVIVCNEGVEKISTVARFKKNNKWYVIELKFIAELNVFTHWMPLPEPPEIKTINQPMQ